MWYINRIKDESYDHLKDAEKPMRFNILLWLKTQQIMYREKELQLNKAHS